MTAAEIIRQLELEPLTIEGGHFCRTYTAPNRVQTPHGSREMGTTIYYLLAGEEFSEMHLLPSDETFHFYLGDPVEMLQLYPDGSSAVFTLGQDLAAGQQVQLTVKGGVWQGTKILPGGSNGFALMGCSVTPGFDYEDYSNAPAADLIAKWPAEAIRIKALSKR